MNSGFYQNFELTCTAIAWRTFHFYFIFFLRGSWQSIFTLVGYIFKGSALKNLTLSAEVAVSKIATSASFPIFPINMHQLLFLLPEICVEIPAKGWICFWKSISFPLRFFWLFSRELLFFANILLLFSFFQQQLFFVFFSFFCLFSKGLLLFGNIFAQQHTRLKPDIFCQTDIIISR